MVPVRSVARFDGRASSCGLGGILADQTAFGAQLMLRSRQVRIIALLFGGYAACYFCRADLSVATPLLIEELGKHGIDRAEAMVRIGAMTSLGVLAYALGKLFLGGLGDFWGRSEE